MKDFKNELIILLWLVLVFSISSHTRMTTQSQPTYNLDTQLVEETIEFSSIGINFLEDSTLYDDFRDSMLEGFNIDLDTIKGLNIYTR